MVKIQDLKVQESFIPKVEELILKIGDDPTTTSMLTVFRNLWEGGDNSEELKLAKNSIAQHLICEQMKANHNWFQPTRVWGDKTCHSCSGLGEIYKFEKAPEVQPCTCDGGFIWKPCTSCEKGVFTKPNGSKVPCRNCTPLKEAYDLEPAYWDAHKGERRVKCRKCLGQKVIHALPGKRKLLPHIESTTPCEVCSGLGWFEPKNRKPKNKPAESDGPFNPVLKALDNIS